MSEAIYDDVIRNESDRLEMTVAIYESADRVRHHDFRTETNTHHPLQTTESDCVKIRSSRVSVVCLVVLCVLLLTAVIALCVYIHTNNTNYTQERDELLTNITNLTEERDRILSGWFYFKSSCYYTSSQYKNCTESRRYCTERGADLIIINSREEEKFVMKKSAITEAWIGLTDSDVEGTWKWVDGSTLTSGYWISGEPNGERAENCVVTCSSSLYHDPFPVSVCGVCSRFSVSRFKLLSRQKVKSLPFPTKASKRYVTNLLSFTIILPYLSCHKLILLAYKRAEMSEAIYDDVIRNESDRLEMTVAIYESADRVRHHDFRTETNTHHPPQSTESDCVKIRSSRVSVVCLVVLCVLLLTAVIALCVYIHTNNTNYTQERDELLTNITNLTEERNQLLINNSHRILLSKQLNEMCFNGMDGWLYYNFSFYFISSDAKNWTESRRYCTEKGADLIIINNREEQNAVQKMADDSKLWIGLTDSDVEDTWKWVDGSTLTSGFWRSGEPNGKTKENCAVSFQSWLLDYPCKSPFKWICEKNILK
ncbi:uncharacterized protein LOC122352417 [Puntigrus tetrazona]|uniref:uncharacterized protein LOC122352417 n=1 Tax=Puntigrus tetrazona TaxID=1606681 RepID=UPI001C893028|nr:uncharacterized protein LOC122352417 [Puntigrus tetrazona]